MFFGSKFCLILLAMLAVNLMPLAATTWATPVIESKADADESQVAMHPEGNMIVISRIQHGLNHVIEATTYQHATNSWSQPKYLSPSDMDAHHFRLAVDPSCNAVVAWQVSDGTQERIQAALYTASTDSWSSTKNLSKKTNNISITHVGISESGNVFIAWNKSSDDRDVFKTVTFSGAVSKWAQPKAEMLHKDDVVPNNTILLTEQLVKRMRIPGQCECKTINPLISLICQSDAEGTTCILRDEG